jgi:predicted secreted protein
LAYQISSAFAIYFVIWWLVLFVTLPFGVRSQAEEGDEHGGTDPGAPILARMRAKLLWTTLIAAVLFAVGWACYRAGFFNIERLARSAGFPF